jgi:hypothetical protein
MEVSGFGAWHRATCLASRRDGVRRASDGRDPRITTAQAGVILKMNRQRVWNLIGRGELPAYGPRNSARRLKLSDVQQLAILGEPICVGEAARILHCPTDNVRALIRAGQLRQRPGSRYPVYRLEVEELVPPWNSASKKR